MIEVSTGDSGPIAAVGAHIDGATELILANLTPSEQKVALPFTAASMRVLDARSFVSAAADPAYLDKLEGNVDRDITLDAFAGRPDRCAMSWRVSCKYWRSAATRRPNF
jgi:hypothetical protein